MIDEFAGLPHGCLLVSNSCFKENTVSQPVCILVRPSKSSKYKLSILLVRGHSLWVCSVIKISPSSVQFLRARAPNPCQALPCQASLPPFRPALPPQEPLKMVGRLHSCTCIPKIGA